MKTRSQGRSFTYSFLYDNHTNYALLGLPDSYPENFQYSGDLKDLSLFKEQLENVSNAYYTMKSVGYMLYSYYNYRNESSAFCMIGSLSENPLFYNVKPTITYYRGLELEKTIFTDSGVKINNEDSKVELKKGGSPVELRDALIKYFSNDDANTTIASGIDYLRNPNLEKNKVLSKVLETIKAAKSIGVNDSIREHLRNSKILRVYNVLPDENGKESILFGSAENLASQRKFFWITQLKDDLSILLKS